MLLPAFNSAFAKPPASPNDAHRQLTGALDLDSILSIRTCRTIANDYTFRHRQKVYQVPKPALPGMRGGRITIEERLDGQRVFRFGKSLLCCREIVATMAQAPSPPTPREFNALGCPADSGKTRCSKAKGQPAHAGRPPAGLALGGRSGRTPALPYPPDSKSCGRGKLAWKPDPKHPWQ
ncbi:MAG TPA: hypothetical protein VGN88_05430 [Phycisphaerae bacterium]|jgi:hypothetical protein